jgi:hypothetical protein
MKQRGFRYCPTCSHKLQKRGLTAAGTQRWYCLHCLGSSIRPRKDLARAFVLERFVAWVLGKDSQSELLMPSRTWREDTAWCWDVTPHVPVTGEVHSVLLMDGTRVGRQVCLIVRSPQYVVSWSFAPWEASWSWDKVLLTIPPPTVIVCDGQKGMLLSIARCWPQTLIQRCLFHVWQNLRTKLTLNPQTEAGINLLTHYLQIWDMTTESDGNAWEETFYEMYAFHKSFLDERTYSQTKLPGKRGWWYTHRNTRAAFKQIAKLLKAKQLFTHLDRRPLEMININTNSIIKTKIPRTTNYMEGGTNSTLKGQLYLHRGMPSAHQQRLTEWYLYAKTEGRKPPRFCL